MQNLFIFLYSTKCRMNSKTKILEKSVTNFTFAHIIAVIIDLQSYTE